MQTRIHQRSRTLPTSVKIRRSGRVIAALTGAALLMSPLAVKASGSYSTGGGGANQLYHLGKKTMYKKLICSSCPLANWEQSAGQAKSLIPRLQGGSEFTSLSNRELQAVIVYLKRRYRL